MQLETSVNALEQRASRIGMPLTRIATNAGLAASTLYRMKDHGSPKLDTLRRINAALSHEEIALRDHLLALHPLAEAPMVREAAE